MARCTYHTRIPLHHSIFILPHFSNLTQVRGEFLDSNTGSFDLIPVPFQMYFFLNFRNSLLASAQISDKRSNQIGGIAVLCESLSYRRNKVSKWSLYQVCKAVHDMIRLCRIVLPSKQVHEFRMTGCTEQQTWLTSRFMSSPNLAGVSETTAPAARTEGQIGLC